MARASWDRGLPSNRQRYRRIRHTNYPTLVPTDTPTPEPSPTPDLRVIDIDPYQILLKKSDCNPDGRYFLPNEGWISPHRNSEVIAGWTVEKGLEYLAETGRIDGWYVYYARGNSNILLPKEVSDNVILFSTISGANLLVNKYEDRMVKEFFYDEIKDPPQIGDLTRAWIKKEINSGGTTEAWYAITFSYRNIIHSISVYGFDKEVKLEDAEYLAKNLLTQLEQIPLSDEVTRKP